MSDEKYNTMTLTIVIITFIIALVVGASYSNNQSRQVGIECIKAGFEWKFGNCIKGEK